MPSLPQVAASATLAAVRRACRDGELLPRGALVVAVSGGADSVCLLHLLSRLAPEFGTRLHVAHFHHGLRGGDADEDARFVAALADSLGLPCTLGRADVAAEAAARRRSLEAAAHDARWAFLRALRARVGAGAVATGHTADDQAETVLLHVLRGSGLKGLAGLAPRACGVVRPLLVLRHVEALSWCREHGVAWREDATNAEPWCRRNIVRLELLPALRRYNPNVVAALAGTATAAQADLAYLTGQAEGAYRRLVGPAEGGGERLSLLGYVELPEALRRHLLLRWLGATTERAHVAAVDALLRHGRSGAAASLPGGREVVRRYDDALLVSRPPGGAAPEGEASASPAGPRPVVALEVPGETVAATWGWRIVAEYRDVAERPVEGGARWVVDFAPASVAPPLVLRSRRPGDRIWLPGLVGASRLQDVLVDAKIPRRERERIGVVEAGGRIVWLIGLRLAAGVAAGSAGRRLRLTVRPLEGRG